MKFDIIEALEVMVTLLLGSFEIQMVTIDSLGYHSSRNQQIDTLRNMLGFLLEQIENNEDSITNEIQSQMENAVKDSEHMNELLKNSRAFPGQEEILKRITEMMRKRHPVLVKVLGKEESEITRDVARRFRVMKEKTNALMERVNGLRRT